MTTKKLYEYYCKQCRIKIEMKTLGYVKCSQCKSGSNIIDYGDYDEPLWAWQPYNWNKK